MAYWRMCQGTTQERTTVKKILLVPAGLLLTFAAQSVLAQGMAAMGMGMGMGMGA